MKNLDYLHRKDVNDLILNQAISWEVECLEQINLSDIQAELGYFWTSTNESGNDHDQYSLSQYLLFLLCRYRTNRDEKFLKIVSEITHAYVVDITKKREVSINLGLTQICSELYKYTNDKTCLTDALLLIRFEEKQSIIGYSSEVIMARNLLTLLDLFCLTNNNEFLLRINQFVLRLINSACFEKGGIYWPFLYRLDVTSQTLYENLLKLVFLALYGTIKNDTFLYVANNITIRSDRRSIKKEMTFRAHGFSLKKLNNESLKFESIVLDILVHLNKLVLSSEIGQQQKILALIRKIKSKHLIKQKFSGKEAYGLANLVEGIVYHYVYKLTRETVYQDLAKSRIVEYLKFKDTIEGNPLRLEKISLLNRLVLSILFDCASDTDALIVHNKSTNTTLFDNYPGIALSKPAVKQFILMARFTRVLLLLREALPYQFNQYLNEELISGNHNETAKFLAFVRHILRSDLMLKKHLAPVYRLELAGHYLMNKYRYIKYNYEVVPDFISKAIEMDEGLFSKLILYVFGETKIVNIKLNPVIKIYSFTFGQYFIYSGCNLIMTRYNPVKHLTEEVTIDRYDLLIVDIFKKEQSIKKAIEEILLFIDYGPEQAIEAAKSVISRIKNLIKEGVLIEYPIK